MQEINIWTGIENLATYSFESTESLQPLISIWIEQKDKLKDSEALKTFYTKLKRRLAIETGMLERLYILDRSIAESLIEHGISASLIPHNSNSNSQKTFSLIQDQYDGVNLVFDFVNDQRILTESFIKELHSLITRNQDSIEAIDSLGRTASVKFIKGQYKIHPNNPTRSDGKI